MAEPQAPTALVLLDYLLDEIRETSALLRVTDLARSARRPWWRNLAFGIVRTPTEVSADLGLQYVGQNIDRARDHWRAAIVHAEELEQFEPRSDAVACLITDLAEAGFAGVPAQLQHETMPAPMKELAVHVDAVVTVIRECDRLVVAARNRWMLEKMRGEAAN